jgi:hypothetical protein
MTNNSVLDSEYKTQTPLRKLPNRQYLASLIRVQVIPVVFKSFEAAQK